MKTFLLDISELAYLSYSQCKIQKILLILVLERNINYHGNIS